jgi:hypothetical protein
MFFSNLWLWWLWLTKTKTYGQLVLGSTTLKSQGKARIATTMGIRLSTMHDRSSLSTCRHGRR